MKPYILTLTLPSPVKGPYPAITFPMDKFMIRVALDASNKQQSYIILFTHLGKEAYRINDSHPDFKSALINVGKYLAEAPGR